MTSQPAVGLLLPCNVTVELVAEGRSLVRIIDPMSMMEAGGMNDDPAVAEVGEAAHERLARVAKALGAHS